MKSILIIAGEKSGEKCGADLVKKFRQTHPDFRFFGIGGESMQQVGVELLYTIEDLSMVGVFEIFSQLPRLKRIFQQIKSAVQKESPVAAVLIDSPDFNLRMAKAIKQLNIPVLYYISPTVWAWRAKRLKVIKNNISKMLLIFPFEKQIYAAQNIPAEYVGHPLMERIPSVGTRQEFFQKFGFDPQKKLIALLPGSRKNEIKRHMPVLAETLQKMMSNHNIQFVILRAENIPESDFTQFLPHGLDRIQILNSDYYDALAASDLALSACGTANLEAAIMETPVIAFYRISPLTYTLKPLVRLKHYSIVNILAKKPVIPELIQKDFTSDRLYHEAEKHLTTQALTVAMIEEFKKIKYVLGEKQASSNAALALENLIAAPVK